MKYLISLLTLLLACSAITGEYLNGTSFEPDSTHKAIVCFGFDDWTTSAIADSFDAHGLRVGFYISRAYSNTKRDTCAQYAAEMGHEIGSHTIEHPDLCTLWATEDYDSVVVELDSSKTWIDSLIQVRDSDFDCKSFVFPHNNSWPAIDSVAFEYYDMVRHNYEDTLGGEQIYYYDGQFPTWRHLYRAVPYYVPSKHSGKWAWNTAAEVASDDTTNTRTNVTNFLDTLRTHHGVAVLCLHPTADTVQEMGQKQWSIVLDEFDSDNLTDVWVTTMDTLYAALEEYLRGYGTSTRPEDAYTLYADCYFDSTRTADSYGYGLGTSANPWALNWNTIDASNTDNLWTNQYMSHFHLGAGEFEYDATLSTEYSCKWSGESAATSTLTFTSTDQDYYGLYPKDHDSFEETTVEVFDLSIAAEATNYHAVWPYCYEFIMHDCIIPANSFNGMKLSGTGHHNYIYRVIFRNSGNYGIETSGSEADSSFIYNCVFELENLTYGVQMSTPKYNRIFNNVFIPYGSGDYALRVVSVNEDSSTNRIYNNLVSDQESEQTNVFRNSEDGPCTAAEWIDYIGDWNADNGNGTMHVSDYMTAPYTAINACSDTVKWGGCQVEIYPTRDYGFSSYGLIQYHKRPAIPGRFATIADSDSLDLILSWAWEEGDTIDITRLPAVSIPDNHDLELLLDVPRGGISLKGGLN